jgi:hypothetical protein
MKDTRKPRTYGATAIRVCLPLRHPAATTERGEEYFYDITEAEAFVRAAWREGDSLDARIQDGRYWDAVFGIAPDGTVYVSPHYATMVARATRVIGKVGQDAN